jgi:hypothetical protein
MPKKISAINANSPTQLNESGCYYCYLMLDKIKHVHTSLLSPL